MRAKNAEKLAELEAKIKDAEENLGETEVRDALHAKADYLAAIGDRDAAVKAYAATEAKTAGSGNKMDLVFSQIRYGRCLRSPAAGTHRANATLGGELGRASRTLLPASADCPCSTRTGTTSRSCWRGGSSSATTAATGSARTGSKCGRALAGQGSQRGAKRMLSNGCGSGGGGGIRAGCGRPCTSNSCPAQQQRRRGPFDGMSKVVRARGARACLCAWCGRRCTRRCLPCTRGT